MIKRLNEYHLYSFGEVIDRCPDFDNAMKVISSILRIRGFNADDVIANTPKKTWFRDNPYKLVLIVKRGQLVELDDKLVLTPEDNKVIAQVKMFNGEGLKYRTIEEPSKWHPERWQHPTVWRAMSPMRKHGLTTLRKEKHKKDEGVEQSIEYLCKKVFDIDDKVRTMLNKGIPKREIFNQLKGSWISNNQLRKLISNTKRYGLVSI